MNHAATIETTGATLCARHSATINASAELTAAQVKAIHALADEWMEPWYSGEMKRGNDVEYWSTGCELTDWMGGDGVYHPGGVCDRSIGLGQSAAVRDAGFAVYCERMRHLGAVFNLWNAVKIMGEIAKNIGNVGAEAKAHIKATRAALKAEHKRLAKV